MSIDYYIDEWKFLQNSSGVNLTVPRIGESVLLHVRSKDRVYRVVDVRYQSNDIRILLIDEK